MPTIKMTHDIRRKIISDLLDGKTKEALAKEYDIDRSTITADQKKNRPLWKSESMEITRRVLTTEANQLLYTEQHLKQHAETNEHFIRHLDAALFSLSVLKKRLKRVKKLFKTA